MKKSFIIYLFFLMLAFYLPVLVNAQENTASVSENSASAEKPSVGEFITVTDPNGGENLIVNKTYRIKWTTSGTSNIKIEFSSNGGGSWTTVISSYPSLPTYYDWYVPYVISANCLIRITDTLAPAITDVSNAVFSIYNPITLTAPVGGEIWGSGEQHDITWTSVNIDSVKIEYSLDNSLTWNTAVASTPASLNKYVWTVPDTIAYQVRLRVTDKDDPNVGVQTPNTFIIIHNMTLTKPNNGENLAMGRPAEIRWANANYDSVTFKFSRDGGLSWSDIATVESDSENIFIWRPEGPVSQNCLLKVVSLHTPTIYDQCDKTFSIFDPVMVNSPNGGESFGALRTSNITWSISGADSVKIEYSLNNGTAWNTVISSYPAISGLYQWVVPDTISSQALIKVSDKADSLVYDISDGVFSISREKEIIVTSPNGGETWVAGKHYTVNWTSIFVDSVRVDYSFDSGTVWVSAVNKEPASSGSFEWTIPDTVSANSLVRVVDITDDSVYGQSETSFTIRKLRPPSNLQATDAGQDNGHAINLSWTLSPDDATIDGYRIYRSRLSTFSGPIDLATLTTLDEIIAAEQTTALLISTIQRGINTYADNFVPVNGVNYYYWLEAYVELSSSAKVQSGIVTLVAEKPLEFRVESPFPNPFNPEVTIRYQIPEKTVVKIRIYDYLGRSVAVLRDNYEEPGSYDVKWNGRDSRGNRMASGVYLYVLEAGKFRNSGRMMLVK